MAGLNEMRERIHKTLRGCSVREAYERHLPAVNVAVVEGKIEVVQALLSRFIIHEIDLSNQNHVALFYLASMSGNVELLIKLADSGFSVDSPLRITPAALPILQNYSGYTGLHLAIKYDRSNVVQFLLVRGANIFIENDQGITPLHFLLEAKKQILMKKSSLEPYNGIINTILQTNEQRDNVSHFHIACTRDKPGIVQNFWQHGACINQTVGAFSGHEGFSPLHFAAKYRCYEVVVFLLKHGANVNQVDRNNMTAMHLIDSLEIAELLLHYGANFTKQDSDGNTALHKAFERRNFKIVDLFLAADMNNTNPTNAIGISHFHIACTRNNEDRVKHFLNNGTSVNSCVPVDLRIEYTFYWDDIDWRGCSPLHFAVAFNQASIVKLLLSENASVETQDARGFTALHLACRSMHEKIEELMMNSLQNLTDQRSSRANRIDWTTNRKDHIEIIEMLLKCKSDVNCHDNFGNTPILGAYAYYTLDDSMFRKKYQQSARDAFLPEMICRRKIILNIFMQHSVDLDTCRYNGSILHHMMKEAQVSDSYSGRDELWILEMFLKKGIFLDPMNKKMLTPLYVAVQATDRIDFIQLLIKHGAGLNFHEPENHSTILHLTLESCSTQYHASEIFKAVLIRGADPNARQLDGSTVLHNLSKILHFSPMSEIFQSLIGAGADIDARDARGRTPLFAACLSWNEDFTKILLHHGADVNIEDNEGRTALCVLYEEKLIKGNLNKHTEKLCKEAAENLFRVLFNHVTKKRATVSEKVLFSRGKVWYYLLSNEILGDRMVNHRRE